MTVQRTIASIKTIPTKELDGTAYLVLMISQKSWIRLR